MITNPRTPTSDELKQLKTYLIASTQDEEYAALLIHGACIAVFPDYCTGGPGYSGKVMTVLYDGGPEQVESYYWYQDRLKRAYPDKKVQETDDETPEDTDL